MRARSISAKDSDNTRMTIAQSREIKTSKTHEKAATTMPNRITSRMYKIVSFRFLFLSRLVIGIPFGNFNHGVL